MSTNYTSEKTMLWAYACMQIMSIAGNVTSDKVDSVLDEEGVPPPELLTILADKLDDLAGAMASANSHGPLERKYNLRRFRRRVRHVHAAMVRRSSLFYADVEGEA